MGHTACRQHLNTSQPGKRDRGGEEGKVLHRRMGGGGGMGGEGEAQARTRGWCLPFPSSSGDWVRVEL